MRSDADVDRLLKAWALWVKGDRSVGGFPAVNVLHSSWLPPAPGTTPTMRTSPCSDDHLHRAVHAAIGRLSVRLANTIVVHYCYRMTVDDQAQLLGCAASTVHQRLQVARARIGAELAVAHGSFTN